MTGKEFANNWQKVIAIYNDTKDKTPKDTAKSIVEQLGIEEALTVFSTIAQIKRYDGRIDERLRKALSDIPYIEEAVDRGDGYPIRLEGIDDIHTTHISQIIEALLEEKNR